MGVVLLLAFPLAAQQSDPTAAVAQQREAFDRAFDRADLDAIAALITDDVTFISAAGGGRPGADALVENLRQMFVERPGLTVAHEAEVIELGPGPWGIASERGRWVEKWLQNGEEVTLEGAYLTLWRREEGTWRIAAELLIALYCIGSYCSDQAWP